jgi:hypothetical protein
MISSGVAGGRIRILPPNTTRLERGCVQSTSRSTLKSFAASGVFQPVDLAKRLRLVFDTAALPGQCADAPPLAGRSKNLKPGTILGVYSLVG